MRTTELSRRRLFAATFGTAFGSAACSRALATRYFGWLFVASAADKSITVGDLSEFRRVTNIPLGETPAQLLQTRGKVFVTCPEAKLLIEIDKGQFRPGAKLAMPGRIANAAVADSGLIVIATSQPATLVLVDPETRSVRYKVALPFDPAVLDINGDVVALASGSSGQVMRMSLKTGRVLGISQLGEPCGSLRFRKDGQLILAGLPRSRQIVTLDGQTGALLARLPLHFAPGKFCFNGDGGQMFVIATGEDSVAIVSPFQNQIDQTIVAGRQPYAMAVSATRNLLLITNPESGDLTILDIETRKLAASVHVGGEPGEVLLTPDEEYALVLSRDAGDVAVVRMQTVLDRANRTKPILTMFPMGSSPQSALVIPQDA
jgi:YVTN family beta-propeller protein